MSSTFRPIAAGESEQLARFLGEVFHATAAAPNLTSKQMEWKYEGPSRDGWSCRSYLICRGERILAHAGLWPVQMCSEEGCHPGMHLIDWAAHWEAPGAGVALLRQIRRTGEVIYTLGGTKVARQIFSAFGFRPIAQLDYYARPLRPWKQILTHQYRWHWKTPARLLRNGWWSLWPRIEVGYWSATCVDPQDNTLWPFPLPGVVVFKRNSDKFRYLALCPLIQTRFYIVCKRDTAVGYFVLTFAPGQARIADAWTPSKDPASWEKLFALATEEALRHPGANEIVTLAGMDPARAALSTCGYHKIKQEALMVHDPKHVLPVGSSVHFQMVDNDHCFLHSGTPIYLT